MYVWLRAGWEVMGVTGLGLGFTNSGGTWRNWDMCLCFGCGGAEREWVGGLGQGLGWWGGGMSLCVVSRDSLFMAGPGICILC